MTVGCGTVRLWTVHEVGQFRLSAAYSLQLAVSPGFMPRPSLSVGALTCVR